MLLRPPAPSSQQRGPVSCREVMLPQQQDVLIPAGHPLLLTGACPVSVGYEDTSRKLIGALQDALQADIDGAPEKEVRSLPSQPQAAAEGSHFSQPGIARQPIA